MPSNEKPPKRPKRRKNRRGNSNISGSGNPQLINQQQTNKSPQLYTQTIAQFTSGPIPDAETLAKYNEIIPDGANRIMVMAENQSTHRQTLETTVIEGGNFRATLGVVFAFIITMTALLGGIYLIILGREITGMIFAGAGLLLQL